MKHKLARRLAHMVPVGCCGEDGVYGDYDKLHPEQRDGLDDIAQAMIDEVSAVIADVQTSAALAEITSTNNAFQLGLLTAISALKQTSDKRETD